MNERSTIDSDQLKADEQDAERRFSVRIHIGFPPGGPGQRGSPKCGRGSTEKASADHVLMHKG
jgi:hypothetical protein